MLSIIICSKYKEINPILKGNIKDTIGIEYEIISIDNSENKYSIFAAYNEGVQRSRYPNLCFVHEDVRFHSTDWGKKIVQRLTDQNIGFCGIAGRDFVTRIPGAWKKELSAANLIQSDKRHRRKTRRKLIPHDFNRESIYPVVVLDGVFLATRKELMRSIIFDESLSRFHGYDYDICFQAVSLGYKNVVVYDILIEHFSLGNPDGEYYLSLFKVFKKWIWMLPKQSYGKKLSKVEIQKIEKDGITKLAKKLVRRKISEETIKTVTDYYLELIADKNSIKKRTQHLNRKIRLYKLLYSIFS